MLDRPHSCDVSTGLVSGVAHSLCFHLALRYTHNGTANEVWKRKVRRRIHTHTHTEREKERERKRERERERKREREREKERERDKGRERGGW